MFRIKYHGFVQGTRAYNTNPPPYLYMVTKYLKQFTYLGENSTSALRGLALLGVALGIHFEKIPFVYWALGNNYIIYG